MLACMAGIGLFVVSVNFTVLHRSLSLVQVKSVRRNFGLWTTASLGLLGTMSLYLAMQHGGILLVGSIFGPEQAGEFAVTVRTAALGMFFLTAVNAKFAPSINSFVKDQHQAELQSATYHASQLVFWPTCVFSILAIAFRHELLQMFNADTAQASISLVILLAANWFDACCGPSGQILTLTGHSRITIYVQIPCLLAGLVIAFTCLSLGPPAIALGTAAAVILQNIALYAIVYRRFGLHCSFISRWISKLASMVS